MSHLALRFEDMPERHAELAYRFGEPDEAFETDREDGQGSRWVLVSPLSTVEELARHLEWASTQLHPHESFIRELISLGGRIILHLHLETREAALPTRFNARLLLPMAHAGVLIELHSDVR